MTINIIHLYRRHDRWRLLHKELKKQGIIDFKIWEGIDLQDDSTRAISKAHKQIVEFARKNNLPEILIAEDDLRFTAPGAFTYFLQNKPEDFDIYLASIYYGHIHNDHTVDDFSGLSLYIIKERFYNRFLSLDETEDIDRALKYKGKFLVCEPFTAIQHSGYSDHYEKHCNFDSYLEGRTLWQGK